MRATRPTLVLAFATAACTEAGTDETAAPWVESVSDAVVQTDLEEGLVYVDVGADGGVLEIDFTERNGGLALTARDGDRSLSWVEGDDAGAGTLLWDGELYRLEGTVTNLRASLTDPDAMPIELEPLRMGTPIGGDRRSPPRAVASRADVLVAYTPDALAAAGSEAQLRATIELAELESNQGFADSGILHSLNIVHMAEVAADELGPAWGVMLEKLRSDDDGFADEVHDLRDQYGADHVVLIVEESTACGIAYVMDDVSAQFADNAFALVSRQCATGYYSFAHELGHNMGSAHHQEFGESAAYDFSYGHRDNDAAFRTIMAYSCPGGCARLNRWSDPSASHEGSPLGVASGSAAADNHQTFSLVRHLVSDFRPEQTGTVVAPSLVQPTDRVIRGGAVRLEWSDGDPIEVSVGDVAGGTAYFDAEVTGSTTFLSGLPADGSPVWIRLAAPGGQPYRDYRFDTEPVAEPQWLSPAGDVIGSNAQIEWSDNGSQRFRLQVVGADGVEIDVVTQNTGVSVTGLSTGFAELRLGWESDSGWNWKPRTVSVR